MRRELETRDRERRIARLAGRQHGVVARRQLVAVGFSHRAIDRRIERGRLHLVHRGVYAVGHRLTTVRGRWMAAVLAAGPGAALSHLAAAALWDLVRYSGLPHVTVPGRAGQRPGLCVHYGRIGPDEVTTRAGIPVTTLARTLLDLAAVLSPQRFAAAIAEAERRRLADSPSLPELLERYPGRRGIRAVRAALADARLGLDVPHSELELRFTEFVASHAIPHPELNVPIRVVDRSIEVDCLWRSARLAVELDGRAWHSDAEAFETDRARDRALVAAGWRPIRVTWRHLHDAPDALAGEIRSALHRTAR